MLSFGIEHPFVIPEYQRPYAWNFDQVDTLFSDIWDFSTSRGGSERNGTYFLGCIVSYENDGNQEIIDGQQRITSLFLLLRAIYTKLEKGVQDNKAINFEQQIRSCIWRADKLTGEVNADEKEQFISEWKELDERATYSRESIQQLFYYYMFYLRTQDGDSNSTLPGVRKYYLDNKERLFAPDLMENLKTLLNLWLVTTKHEAIENESWSA